MVVKTNFTDLAEGKIYYFPWLRLQKIVHIDEISLIPYPLSEKMKDLELPDWIKEQLNKLNSSYLNRKCKPLSTITLLSGPTGPIIQTQDQYILKLFERLELTLILIHFRYRDYDTGGHTGLQFLPHKAEIKKGRKEIFLFYRSWFNDLWITPSLGMDKITIPWPVQLFSSRFDLPLRRIKEIFRSLAGESVPLIRRIHLPMHFLKIACSDYQAIKPENSISILAQAFEYLFNRPNLSGDIAMAFELEDLWNIKTRIQLHHPIPFKNKQLKEIIENRSFRLTKRPTANKTWLQAWFLEFFNLRNDVLSGSNIKIKEYTWNITQHLRIASEILPMTILIMLNRDPSVRLPLKIEDETRIKNVDHYLQYAKELWFTSNDFLSEGPKWLEGQIHPKLWDSIP